jgi:uncharacterized protein YcnI
VTLLELTWLQTGLLLLTPAIVLAVVVALGRYPGEKLLVRTSSRPPRRRRRVAIAQLVWLAPSVRIGGGLLLGHSLAGRAPPPAVSFPNYPTHASRRNPNMKKSIAALSVAALIALPATASAHVTLNPGTASAKGFTELLIRVPNERDNANTNRVDIKFPPGFVFASYQPKPGWTVKVQKRKLAKPVKTDDGTVTEEVARMTFMGTGKGVGTIPPGAFQDFPISVQVPDKAGQTLWFPALQTYSNGEVVRWITEDESADEPAPHIDVTAAAAEGGHGATATTAAPAKPAATTTSTDDDAPSKGSVIVAIVLGALALLVGLVALVRGRRSELRVG